MISGISGNSGESTRPYICHNIGCDQSFVHQSQRSRHAEKCTKPKPNNVELVIKNHDNTYTCKTCSKIFKHRNNVKRHLKVCQNKASSCKNEIKCLECGKTFSCNPKLKRHVKTHESVEL